MLPVIHVPRLNLGSPQSVGLRHLWVPTPNTGKLLDLFRHSQGTFVSDAAIGADSVMGVALVLDGTNDYVNVGTEYDWIRQKNAFTIWAWVYITKLTSDGAVVGRWSGAQATEQFMLWMDTGGSDGYAAIIEHSSTQTRRCGESIASASINTWQHVAATWDGATIRIYVDGIQADSATGNGVSIDSSSIAIGIGSRYGSTSSSPFPGRIGVVGMHDRALEPDVIASLHDAATRWELLTPPKQYWLLQISENAITGTGSLAAQPVTIAGTGTYTPLAITGAGTVAVQPAAIAGTGTYAPLAITGTGGVSAQPVQIAGVGMTTGVLARLAIMIAARYMAGIEDAPRYNLSLSDAARYNVSIEDK